MSRAERWGWALYCLVGVLIVIWCIPLLAETYRRESWEVFQVYGTIVAFCGAATIAVGISVISSKPKK